jgi:hypothetical protein
LNLKARGKPEQHKRIGVFFFINFHGDTGGSNPLGDANQIKELPVSGSSFYFYCDKFWGPKGVPSYNYQISYVEKRTCSSDMVSNQLVVWVAWKRALTSVLKIDYFLPLPGFVIFGEPCRIKN